MRKKVLLLINGNQVIMDINKRILERAGYTVCTALGFDQALEDIQLSAPDGIILAKDHVDGSGLEYLRTLRSLHNIPVMYISDSRDDEVVALHAGANEFLRKPYNFEVFITRVRLMISRSEYLGALQSADEHEMGSEEPEAEAEGKEESKQTEPPVPAPRATGPEAELLGIVGKPGIRRTRSILAASFASLLVIGGIIALLLTRGPDVEIVDHMLPLAEFPPLLGEGPSFGSEMGRRLYIPIVDKIIVPASSTEVAIHLTNPEQNDCYFAFEIVLKDTCESLFMSELVAPGGRIESISISESLDAGNSDALLVIHTYALEDLSSLGNIYVDFVITAK